jgi:hypothetical protein
MVLRASRSTARLVTSTFSLGHPVNSSESTVAAAITCSKLSTRSRPRGADGAASGGLLDGDLVAEPLEARDEAAECCASVAPSK